MFNKIRNTMLALAAIAALGLATLVTSTTSADAARGGGFSRGGGGNIGMRHVGGGRSFGGMRHIGGRHIGLRIRHVHHHRHPNWCRWHGRCHVHVRWHRPWLYAAPVAAVAAYATTTTAAPRCTCLTKEYTKDNLVVFTDVCTKEFASAPVGTTTQSQLQQEQAPTQQ